MIKTLARCIREYKWPAILAPVCMIGEVYMETKIPLLLAQVVDQGVSVGNMGAVVSNGGLLVLYALISLPLRAFPGTCAMICIIRCRNMTLPTLTNSPRRRSSPG